MKTAIVERDVAHLIFPDEVQDLAAPATEAGGPRGRTGSRRIAPPADALLHAVERISEATRPIIVVGNGAKGSMDTIIRLAAKLGAPIATTFKAKGLVSERHPLSCGVLGRSGTPVASWMMNESDLVIVFGASFANHTGIADYKPIVQVDYDPMALGRFHPVEVAVQGDIGETSALLLDHVDAVADRADRTKDEVSQRRQLWTAEKASRSSDRGDGLSSALVMDSLTRLVAADAVLTVDVGNNAYSFGRYFESSGRQDLLMSGYLGSIGFAFPAAMGAWAATDGRRQIVSISGDGGFGQYAMELTTAAKYDMAITHVLLNNSELGKISKEQLAAEHQVWQTSLVNPDFAEFALLCGAHGQRVTAAGQLDAAIRDALAHPGPSLVEIITDPLLV
ncbi:MAG: thiamine pyrophosphate-binding protein [Acidimicrobiales bacterium]